LPILHHLSGTRCLSGTALSTTGTIPKALLLHGSALPGTSSPKVSFHGLPPLGHLASVRPVHQPCLLHVAVPEAGLGLHRAITILDHHHLLLLLLHRSHLPAVAVLAGPGHVSHALLTATSGTTSWSTTSEAFRAGNHDDQAHDNDSHQSIHQTTPLHSVTKIEPASLPQGR